MKTIKLTFLLSIAIVLFGSCSDDNDNPPVIPDGDYAHGYFVVNEGPFNNGSGTITFVGDDGTVSQNIYKTVNNEDLGNIAQSMHIANGKAYIVVNNSHKIVVAESETMEKITTIEGEDIQNPRYFVTSGNAGYLSNWGDPTNPSDDFIAVIDLQTNQVVTTISVGEGPENMVIEGGKLFVNLEGGYNQNNKVEVINISSNSVETTLTVGDVPNSIVKDGTGNVWVLCGGTPGWTGAETEGKLFKIQASNNSMTSFDFGTVINPEHPESLSFSSGNLYYHLNGNVFEMDAKATVLPTERLDGLAGFYYTMKAHDGEIYATDAADFASEGSLKVFNITTGQLMETITTGIIPGDIVFHN